MAGQVALSKGDSAFNRKLVFGLVAGFAALVLAYLVLGRVLTLLSRQPPIVEGLAPSHCGQFIALAKSAYGDDWRVRLDPRDTTCAPEISAEWERQQLPRIVPQDSLTPQPDPQEVAAPVVVHRPAPETRCLNVISLAKAKYGTDWRSKLEGPEAQACAGEAPAAP